ncbi:hypothetical protein ACHAO9_007163 [Fusarium lateritium]
MSERPPAKRRPEAENSPEQTNKRTKIAKAQQPNASAVELAKACLEEKPALGEGELEGISCNRFKHVPDRRSREIDEQANILWENSVEKADFDQCDFESNTPATRAFTALWKVCLRVFNISPLTLISPAVGIRYAPATGRGAKPGSQIVFSRDFSQLLAALIVHPGLRRNALMFSMALQYAVKRRVDNRDAWPTKSLVIQCPAILALRQASHADDTGSTSIHEIHLGVRRNDRIDPTPFSDFLIHLGSMVKKKADDDQMFLGVPALPVTVHDLKLLTEAVSTFQWPDESWRCRPDDMYQAYLDNRGSAKQELPQRNQMKDLVLGTLKDYFRVIVVLQESPSVSGEDREETPKHPDEGRKKGPSDEDDKQESTPLTRRRRREVHMSPEEERQESPLLPRDGRRESHTSPEQEREESLPLPEGRQRESLDQEDQADDGFNDFDFGFDDDSLFTQRHDSGQHMQARPKALGLSSLPRPLTPKPSGRVETAGHVGESPYDVNHRLGRLEEGQDSLAEEVKRIKDKVTSLQVQRPMDASASNAASCVRELEFQVKTLEYRNESLETELGKARKANSDLSTRAKCLAVLEAEKGVELCRLKAQLTTQAMALAKKDEALDETTAQLVARDRKLIGKDKELAKAKAFEIERSTAINEAGAQSAAQAEAFAAKTTEVNALQASISELESNLPEVRPSQVQEPICPKKYYIRAKEGTKMPIWTTKVFGFTETGGSQRGFPATRNIMLEDDPERMQLKKAYLG